MFQRILKISVLTLALTAIAPQALAKKSWIMGLSGLGGLYAHNQDDFNALISQTGGPGFDSKTQWYWGGQFEFYSLHFPARFTIGFRYEQLKEKVSADNITSTTGARLYSLTDTFYFLPFRDGLNVYLRIAFGYMQGKGSYQLGDALLDFKGNYFTASGELGMELLYGHIALDLGIGYRYARVPKLTVDSASGTAFTGFSPGGTLMIVESGDSRKFKLDFSGVTYVATLKFYF